MNNHVCYHLIFITQLILVLGDSSRLGLLPYLQLVKCLQKGSRGAKDSLLVGKVMDVEEMDAAASKSAMVSCSLALSRLELAVIFDDFDLAGEILSEAPDVLKLRPGHFSGCRFTFYEYLTSVKLARRGSKKSACWSKRANAAMKQIEMWVKEGNVNCNHLLPLVAAEYALMKGKKKLARKNFNRVVNEAESGSYYLQDKAISMNCAANFYHMEGDIDKAFSCYEKCRNLWSEYGAAAKVKAMDVYSGYWSIPETSYHSKTDDSLRGDAG